jgi:hypothetical protein
MVLVFVNIRSDVERIHDAVGCDDVRTAFAADRTELVVDAVDVFDAKRLGTDTTARRLIPAPFGRTRARGRWNNTGDGH